MKQILITQLLNVMMAMLSPELLKTAVDKILDIVEDAVAKSPNTVDDTVVLPLVAMIRKTFDIPDNDFTPK